MEASASLWTNEALEHTDRAEALNRRYAGSSAIELIHAACTELFPDRIAAVSSFGAETAVLLDVLP